MSINVCFKVYKELALCNESPGRALRATKDAEKKYLKLIQSSWLETGAEEDGQEQFSHQAKPVVN